jgi:hypothetical protein
MVRAPNQVGAEDYSRVVVLETLSGVDAAAARRTARVPTPSGSSVARRRQRSEVLRPPATSGCQPGSEMFSSTICWDCRSMTIGQPEGRNGKPSSISRFSPRPVCAVRARSRRSKRNSFRWWPTSSRTVRTALSRVRRSPGPNCCRKRAALSGGRRNSTVSTSGRSRPSSIRPSTSVSGQLVTRQLPEARRPACIVPGRSGQAVEHGQQGGVGHGVGQRLPDVSQTLQRVFAGQPGAVERSHGRGAALGLDAVQ